MPGDYRFLVQFVDVQNLVCVTFSSTFWELCTPSYHYHFHVWARWPIPCLPDMLLTSISNSGSFYISSDEWNIVKNILMNTIFFHSVQKIKIFCSVISEFFIHTVHI
jgi:hypothetical protein